jgi:hypothetical protein
VIGHIQHLSLESLVKMDHLQKEPPLNLTTGAHVGSNGVHGMSALGQKQTFAAHKPMSAKCQ